MISKIIKIALTGTIWSFIFIYCSNLLFIWLWGFNLLDIESWMRISSYWNHGGAISQGKDYVFLFMILMLLPIWLLVWKKLYYTNYVQILIFPFILYNKHVINECKSPSGRTALKNIGQSKKIKLEIKEKQNTIKPQPEQDADKIRAAIKAKLNSTHPDSVS